MSLCYAETRNSADMKVECIYGRHARRGALNRRLYTYFAHAQRQLMGSSDSIFLRF